MTAEYTTVKYSPEFKEGVAKLQTHLWSSDPSFNTRYFEWKYERNPYQQEPLVYLALADGHVVGMRGFYPSKWQAGSPTQVHDILIADDMLVSPEHRNRGLVTKIMECAFQDLAGKRYPFVLNLAGRPITVLGSLTMGWKSIGGVCPVGRCDSTVRTLERVRSFVGRQRFTWRFQRSPLLHSASERRPFRHLGRAGARGSLSMDSRIAMSREPRPQAMADLVERLPQDGRIRQLRDAGFFTWRLGNPLGEYRYLYWEDPELEGYLVLKRGTSDLANRTRITIVDLATANSEALGSLLAATVNKGRFVGLNTWTATLPQNVIGVLTSLGFVPVGAGNAQRGLPCVLIRPLRGDVDSTSPWTVGGLAALEMENWDLRPLDAPSG
jgi:GNAT superfamily N-acetyltransferase